MSRQLESYSIPPAVRRVAEAFRTTGWISFWTQLVLAVISAIVLTFSGLSLGATVATAPGGVPATPTTSPETGVGLFFAVCGLVSLFVGAFWAFRYTRVSRKLRDADAQVRPKKVDVNQTLRLGLIVNLIGMVLTILGAQAIVGSLVAKSFAQGFSFFSGVPSRFINPLDVFLVQANVNIIMAHFVGLLATLWLLRSMSRQ
jgi:hypothetical protein